MVRLLVALAVIDDDATEVGDCFHQVLEAVVPVGGDLKDEHDSLMREAKLEITDFADVVDKILGVVLNRVDRSRLAGGYGYGYYSYGDR